MDKFSHPIAMLVTSFKILWKLWTTGSVTSAEWLELGDKAGVLKN